MIKRYHSPTPYENNWKTDKLCFEHQVSDILVKSWAVNKFGWPWNQIKNTARCARRVSSRRISPLLRPAPYATEENWKIRSGLEILFRGFGRGD